ncbi:MAG: D-amino acid dehydrogenase [Alphaproteobacteria bacterium]|nr:D-amino acid dehydrogenase [Alphaproteobacteria bacterium]MBL6775996.1 D-amino acid dehydrogenase [Alphaproteobacteria bacterium]
MKHFAVIGAGITGVTTAWVLRQRGYDVTVFDRHRYPAMETSFANGGQLSASNAEVWTNINTILKGLKWLFKSDAPLSMNLRPSWHKFSWLASFAGQCGNYEKNTVATAKMAIESRRYMAEFAKNAGVEFDREDSGILHIYKREADFAHAHNVTNMLAKAGLMRRRLSTDEVYDIEPALQAEVIGGYYTDSDFTGDIHKFANVLAEAAERAGVKFAMNTQITDIHHGGDKPHLFWENLDGDANECTFDGVVITAGVMSRKLASALGDNVNVYPVKGYSITVDLKDATSQAAAPVVSLLDDAAKIVTARLGKNRFRVAGTAEINGINYDIRADRIAPLTRWVEDNFPDICTKAVTPWAGLRPMMPSMMPHIGAGRKKGVFYNTGHGHLGWTLSCVSAQMIGDIVHAKGNHL